MQENRLRLYGWPYPKCFRKVLFSMMTSWNIYSIRATASENHRFAPEQMPGVTGRVFEMLCVGVLVCCIGVLWLVEVLK